MADSEDDLPDAGYNALDELEQALDGDAQAVDQALGDEYYDDGEQGDHFEEPGGGGVQYDFPGNAMGASAGSLGGGVCAASTSSLPEEINVTTNGLIEETVQRLTFVHGVMGVLIIDMDGKIVHATMPPEEAAQLTGPTLQMLQRARTACKNLEDELQMLCVRTRKYEMLLCAEGAGKFAMCVLQDPQPDSAETSLIFEGSKAARSVLKGATLSRGEAGAVFF
jgi:predicted regulator of Ras-like GTPase activity (Roadblock/LC7/MglB family)